MRLWSVVDPELTIGWHHSNKSGEALLQVVRITTSVTPVLLGARASLPLSPLAPWVGAHGGWARVTVGISGFEDSRSGLAFDAGAGLDFRPRRELEFGLGGWYYVLPANDTQSFRMLSIGLEARLAL